MSTEIRQGSIIEGMPFFTALNTLLLEAEHPQGFKNDIDGMNFLPFYVRVGKISYEDVMKLNKLGIDAQQYLIDIGQKDELSQLQEGLITLSTFFTGVEVGKRLAAQIILDSSK